MHNKISLMKWRDNQELLKENPGGSIQATCGCLIKAAETCLAAFYRPATNSSPPVFRPPGDIE